MEDALFPGSDGGSIGMGGQGRAMASTVSRSRQVLTLIELSVIKMESLLIGDLVEMGPSRFVGVGSAISMVSTTAMMVHCRLNIPSSKILLIATARGTLNNAFAVGDIDPIDIPT
ncbi:hypothetical protein [Streptosporangium jomthongense]|uniref:Uncharacterized protein n=1 Tax=Streptosporangium jomthongense TaxID=1193683 RepID=A0ABV8EWK4_9ACTN